MSIIGYAVTGAVGVYMFVAGAFSALASDMPALRREPSWKLLAIGLGWPVFLAIGLARGDRSASYVRFANEAEFIRSGGGTMVRIVGRGGLDGANGDHISEHGGVPCDVVLDNSGTFEDLAARVDDLVGGLLPNRKVSK